MGRTASGVKGINLDGGICVSLETTKESDNIILVTEKNGNIVAIKRVIDDCDLMLITDSGIIIRIPVDQISQLGRVTQGTRLINLKDNQKVSSISLIKNDNVSRETLDEEQKFDDEQNNE